jgi:hypothetical protein
MSSASLKPIHYFTIKDNDTGIFIKVIIFENGYVSLKNQKGKPYFVFCKSHIALVKVIIKLFNQAIEEIEKRQK